jgi:hypothetical protein
LFNSTIGSEGGYSVFSAVEEEEEEEVEKEVEEEKVEGVEEVGEGDEEEEGEREGKGEGGGDIYDQMKKERQLLAVIDRDSGNSNCNGNGKSSGSGSGRERRSSGTGTGSINISPKMTTSELFQLPISSTLVQLNSRLSTPSTTSSFSASNQQGGVEVDGRGGERGGVRGRSGSGELFVGMRRRKSLDLLPPSTDSTDSNLSRINSGNVNDSSGNGKNGDCDESNSGKGDGCSGNSGNDTGAGAGAGAGTSAVANNFDAGTSINTVGKVGEEVVGKEQASAPIPVIISLTGSVTAPVNVHVTTQFFPASVNVTLPATDTAVNVPVPVVTESRDFLSLFQEGVDRYLLGQWGTAREILVRTDALMKQLQPDVGGDGPSQVSTIYTPIYR